MKQHDNSYTMENYGTKGTFASFLPGISGVKGIPIWCFYVNRGQAVCSFGVENKENSIMEFAPAHQSYQRVKTTGFRTFIKVKGKVYEPFLNDRKANKMMISMNSLALEETDPESGFRTEIEYYTLPNEPMGGLVRKLTVTNQSGEEQKIELLDGMPMVIPYGVSLGLIKDIGQTAKAWMQVEDVEQRMPYYRVGASIEDSAEVEIVEAGNFALGYDADGSLLPVIADPACVFAYDSALRIPVSFEENSLAELVLAEQVTANEYPCCFFGKEQILAPGESLTLHELYGHVHKKDILHAFVEQEKKADYFIRKKEEAEQLTMELTDRVKTATASKEFDEYCRYNFMDNVLRGGFPVRLGKDKIFYTYSRKHGDLERDYNFFSMQPEYYSQGNGNYRDVNQNRRCDTFFAPYVGRENIRKFYSLIQLDGYNPLCIEKLTYRVSEEKGKELLEKLNPEILSYVQKVFTPGALLMKLEELMDAGEAEKQLQLIMDAADSMNNETFGEGYWCDHWTYNLDLVEEYLEVFPEQEKELFFEEELTCFLSQVNINDRRKRYVETKNGLRQYRSLNETSKRSTEETLVRTNYQQGDVLRMSLLEKLVMLCGVKFAALDAYGMGIEMEGGKPGWYDALNGLPGMLGSSMNETYELCRMLDYTANVIERYQKDLPVLREVADLLMLLEQINQEEYDEIHRFDAEKDACRIRKNGQLTEFWNKINDAKEAYRNQVFAGIHGDKTVMTFKDLLRILTGFADTVRSGIQKAKTLGEGKIPSYYAYEAKQYTVGEDGIYPEVFEPVDTPHFLEGTVRYLKLHDTLEQKKNLYREVRESALYDRKLHMYKVNASLSSASYELGRAVAFLPGWLENESIWLHMEYKYLLELIRSGLYEEFFEDLKNAAVPFMDPEIYGRSIYENSSFLVSSVYPQAALHGKGFVARLSGSTIEFISMWKRMMFGSHILKMQDGELVFAPEPALPRYLIPEDGKVTAVLFGTVEVEYQFQTQKDYIPGTYEISNMTFVYPEGETQECTGQTAGGFIPTDLRQGKIQKVIIQIK